MIVDGIVGVRSGTRLRPVAYGELTPGKRNAIWLSGGACRER